MDADLGEFVTVWKKNCQDGTPTQQILNFESVKIGVVSRLIIVEHQIDGV